MNKEFNEFVRRSTPLINDHFAELMEKVEKHQPHAGADDGVFVQRWRQARPSVNITSHFRGAGRAHQSRCVNGRSR